MAQNIEPTSKGWMRPFLFIWTAQTISILGSSVAQFALIWWLTQSTGSATVLSTATLVAFIPEVFLGPFAGALVDRWNRKLVLILSDLIVAAFAVLLILSFAFGFQAVWQVYVILFLRALSGVFQFTAMQSSTSLMVPDEHLARVAGINSSLRGALNIVAPMLGAFLMSIAPLPVILISDPLSAVLAVLPLLFIKIPQPRRQENGSVAVNNVFADVREGLRYVLRWPAMIWVMAMAMVINFVSMPAVALNPILVSKFFQGDAVQLGLMQSGYGLGVVAGGLLLGAWGGFQRKILTVLCGLVGMGLRYGLISAAPANIFWLAVAGMFLAGIMNPIVNGPIFAIIQTKVAPEMQGRVFTLLFSGASAMVPLSMLVSGPLADGFGVRLWFLIGAVGFILIGLSGFVVPVAMRIEEDAPPVEKLPVSTLRTFAEE